MPARYAFATLSTLLLALSSSSAGQATATDNQALVVQAQTRWKTSPHGELLARILPPWRNPSNLPQAESRGARLVVRYCVQCHHLPNPAMHPPDRWPKVVERMVARMQGKGNMGALMKDMMAEVTAPSQEELHVLLDYLSRHAQKPLDPRRYPDLATRGHAFREACSQCHALPDPKSHDAREWPDVVARMERNMQWMNRIAGSKPDPGEPQLTVDAIVDYLKRHAATNLAR
jgi:cytochrome c2